MQTSKCRSASIPRRLLTSSRYPLDAVRASIIQSYCSGSKQPGKMVKGETGRGERVVKKKKEKKERKKEKNWEKVRCQRVPSAAVRLSRFHSLKKDKNSRAYCPLAYYKLRFLFNFNHFTIYPFVRCHFCNVKINFSIAI